MRRIVSPARGEPYGDRPSASVMVPPVRLAASVEVHGLPPVCPKPATPTTPPPPPPRRPPPHRFRGAGAGTATPPPRPPRRPTPSTQFRGGRVGHGKPGERAVPGPGDGGRHQGRAGPVTALVDPRRPVHLPDGRGDRQHDPQRRPAVDAGAAARLAVAGAVVHRRLHPGLRCAPVQRGSGG